MPLTDPVAGRQTGGPAPLTITDLQRHAGCGWEGGVDRCENAVLRQILVREQCGVCDGNGVNVIYGPKPAISTRGRRAGPDRRASDWTGTCDYDQNTRISWIRSLRAIATVS